MITAYLVGIPAYHENDNIEIRYRIYVQDELAQSKSIYKEYKKPLVVNLFSLITLLKELEIYKDRDISILMNDAAIHEQIKGSSTTKNKDVLKMSDLAREKLNQFGNKVTIRDVSKDNLALQKWNEVLTDGRKFDYERKRNQKA